MMHKSSLAKRARLALSALILLVLGASALASCTETSDNPCNTGKALLSTACGVGACQRFIDSQEACDPTTGLPVTCTPGKAAQEDTCGDGFDNDCDGSVDENDSGTCTCTAMTTKSCYMGSPETRNLGVCHDGTQACLSSAWGPCIDDVLPTTEICDGLDNNCNGEVDEGCSCKDGAEQACYGGPASTRNVGVCKEGTQTCKGNKWDPCIGDIAPEPEDCSTNDLNCDGIPANGSHCECIDGTMSTDDIPNYPGECYTGPANTKGKGPCHGGYFVCKDSHWSTSMCIGEVTPQLEQCGGDFNCDGVPDTGGVACLDDGKPCAQDNDCKNKHCVDGVCCDQVCNGTCLACTSLKKGGGLNGVCGYIAAGSDPDQECLAGNQADCKNKGGCDGMGACAKYPNGVQCLAAACEADGVTLDKPKICDGLGLCTSGGTHICAPYGCDSAKGACRTSCINDADCSSGGYCNGLICLTKKLPGIPCNAANECVTGSCVDGVCCDSSCASICQACTAAKKGSGADGACGNVAVGIDPDNDCVQDPQSTCKQDGACNGQGACRLYQLGYVCAMASCAGSILTPPSVCDGVGTCLPAPPLNCSPYACTNGNCLQTCSSDVDCSSSSYCVGVNCQNKKGLGAVCAAAHECTSGFCVDGVCCNSACSGACMSCSLALPGTCANIPSGQPDNSPVCGGPGDPAHACSGGGACLLSSGQPCSLDTECASNICQGNPKSCQ